MRDVIIEASYNDSNGVSTIKLDTGWGVTERQVRLSEEDTDIANKWDGQRFAHYKCVADKYRFKARAFHERAIGVKSAISTLTQAYKQKDTVLTDDIQYTIDMLNRQHDILERESQTYYQAAKDMKVKYVDYMEDILKNRREIRERIKYKNAEKESND